MQKQIFVVQKHNEYYWAIFNTLEEEKLYIGVNYLLFEDEESAKLVCEQLNKSKCFC